MSFGNKDIWRNNKHLIYESKIIRRLQKQYTNIFNSYIQVYQRAHTVYAKQVLTPINHDDKVTWLTGITQPPSWTNLYTFLVPLWMLCMVFVIWCSLINDSKDLSLMKIILTLLNVHSTMKKNNHIMAEHVFLIN